MAGRVLPIRRAAPPRQQQPAPPAAPLPLRTTWPTLAWRTGDKVRWHGYTGTFLRETVDDQAEGDRPEPGGVLCPPLAVAGRGHDAVADHAGVGRA